MDTNTQSPEMESTQTQNGILKEWTAPIHPPVTRGPIWYSIMSLIAVVFLGGSIWKGNWSFAIVIVLCTFVYFLVHRRSVEKAITIREDGILFDGEFEEWKEFTGFWILVAEEYGELHIERTSKRKEDMVIQTGNNDPFELRTLLLQYLKEFPDRTEKPLDTIIRICKL